jgi:flagella basal body P-ring formation protein FlgA
VRGKGICIGLTTLILLFFVQTVEAANLENDIREEIVALYNLDTTAIKIELQRNTINPEIGEYDSIRVIPMTKTEPVGIFPIQVELFGGGKKIGDGQVRVNIARFENVLVTLEPVKRNGILDPGKITIERMETTALTDRPLTDARELVGKWTKRNIRKGQIIMAGMIEEIPPIVSGKDISILYKSSWLEIAAPGKSLESGYVGEAIKIKNKETGKIIKGTVIDDKTVLISNL